MSIILNKIVKQETN